jgi:hypothetical protein
MKINGEVVNIREVVEVVFNRNNGTTLKLKVSGYPIGISRDYLMVYPRPVAPVVATGVVSVKTGPEKKPNYEDPTFVAAYEEYVYLEKFYFICKCLSVDTSVSFNADFNTLAGLRAIPNELKEAGFSEGDIGKLLEAIRSATNIEAKAIEEATSNFT